MNPIHTTRLILREMEYTDIDGIFELDRDPQVHHFLGTEVLTHKNQSVEVISMIRKHYSDFGIGRWAVVDRHTQEFMGWCGLQYYLTEMNEQQAFHELGCRLIPRFWGQGIATEAAMATVIHGFNTLHINEIYAMAHGNNEASIRLLSNMGFTSLAFFYAGKEPINWFKLAATKFDMK